MRATRLVLLLFTAGRASADGFHAGDAWRGTMTNCQQSPHMLRRAVRYIAIELSVLAVDDRKVEVQFQNHAQKDMSYKLHGEYDPSQRRLHLRAAQTTGNFGKGWSSCDALAHLSADFSTLSGVALCQGRACDHGGGEFVLRHDRGRGRAGPLHRRVGRVRSHALGPRLHPLDQGEVVAAGRQRRPEVLPVAAAVLAPKPR